MLLIAVVTLLVTVVVSAIVGFIVARNSAKNRYADVFEAMGQKDLAQKLRDDPPVTPYYVISGLAGAIPGLMLGGILPMTMIAWMGLDFHEHRMIVARLFFGNVLLGFIVGIIAGKIVTRRS